MINKRKSYKIVNNEKVLKYMGRLQYFRTKATAVIEKRKLKKELRLDLRIEKC